MVLCKKTKLTEVGKNSTEKERRKVSKKLTCPPEELEQMSPRVLRRTAIKKTGVTKEKRPVEPAVF